MGKLKLAPLLGYGENKTIILQTEMYISGQRQVAECKGQLMSCMVAGTKQWVEEMPGD